jgi:hypothetical protein
MYFPFVDNITHGDYHATSDQFIMTNVMLPRGIFKGYKINIIYDQIF